MKKSYKSTKYLKVDIDIPINNPLGQYLKDLIIQRTYKLIEWLGLDAELVITKPSTNNKMHLWIWLKEPIPTWLAFLYQFLLGDDANRSYYNFMRESSHYPELFNILFSIKKKK